MQTIRLENSGLEFELKGTEYEITGPEGTTASGTVETSGMTEDEAWEAASDFFKAYLDNHSIAVMEHDGIVKRVAYDEERGDFIQVQAVKHGDDCYTIQEFNTNLVFLREYETDILYRDYILKFLQEQYNIKTGLSVWVYKHSLGDCTNGGISSAVNELYLMDCETSPFYPTDLRQCVKLAGREVIGESYTFAKPIVFPKRWYMAGGNFLHTSDSRYKETTGISYPLSIHDRYEG